VFDAQMSELGQFNAEDTVIATFAAAQDETVQVTGVSNSRATLFVSLQERVGFYDANFARFLWELINDSQNVSWQNISSNVEGGWGLIDTEQPDNWQAINSNTSPSWDDIDTDPGTGWNKINTV
jgi:hypothetical protein